MPLRLGLQASGTRTIPSLLSLLPAVLGGELSDAVPAAMPLKPKETLLETVVYHSNRKGTSTLYNSRVTSCLAGR